MKEIFRVPFRFFWTQLKGLCTGNGCYIDSDTDTGVVLWDTLFKCSSWHGDIVSRPIASWYISGKWFLCLTFSVLKASPLQGHLCFTVTFFKLFKVAVYNWFHCTVATNQSQPFFKDYFARKGSEFKGGINLLMYHPIRYDVWLLNVTECR